MAVSCGMGGVTVTENEHDPVWVSDAVAVHCTVVVATLNGDPDAGVQLSVTGATPPVAVGTVYVTGTGPPLGEPVVIAAGQVIDGAPVGGGVGGVVGGVGVVGVDPPHAPTARAASSTAHRPSL